MDRSRPPPPRYGLPPGPPQPQQPAYDPFQRRDPFLPTPHPEKREDAHHSPSYRPGDGLGSLPRGIEFPLKDVHQPSHAPPPSPFYSNTHAYQDEDFRRRSIGGGYQGGSLDQQQQAPAPPPPHPSASSTSYTARHLGSHATSPTQQSNGSIYGNPSSHSALPPQHPSSREEPPRTYPTHRPNTSMSISSIMGSDQPTLPQPSHPPAQTPQPSFPHGSPSWARSPLAAVPDAGRRPRTPDRYQLNRGSHPNSGISSPEQSRYGPFGPITPPFGVSSPTNSHVPPRPFSQPAGQDRHPEPYQAGNRDDHIPSKGQQYAGTYYGPDPRDRGSRDRAISDIGSTRPLLTGREEPRNFHPGERPHPHEDGHGRDGRVFEDVKRDHNSADLGHLARDVAQGQQTPSRPFEFLNRDDNRYAGARVPPALVDSTNAPSPVDVRHEPLSRDAPGRSTPRSSAVEHQLRRSIEDAAGFAPRSVFNNADFARRLDRGSPLPQAVHGVSERPFGSGRDPGIKNEFKRIFSGLGSGVGSTPQPLPPNGTGTPGRASPSRDERDADLPGSGAPASNNKRGRKIYEAGYDSDSADGRSSPIPGRSNTKKSKQQQQAQQQSSAAHHHHHLPPSHHHHHHHRKAEEPANSLNRRASNTPINTLKYNNNTASQPNGAVPAAAGSMPHHHHHHGPHHHHHHHASAPPPAQPPAPLRRPLTMIKTKPLLESIANLPRKHLGSQLYEPSVCSAPSSHPTTFDPRDVIASKPNAIPRFDGKENCTFTIRVPRTYLHEAYRELLCRDRRIWGTDVYTDDSDPVAAAIHSGWILGAWPKDVDVEQLDLTVNQASAKAATESAMRSSQRREVVSAPPDEGPLTPPMERDLHLTLLILPPLQKYASSVWHGVKSRSWGDNHDGMSFKIEKLEWVDEGVVGRMRGRDAKSWKQSINEDRFPVGVKKAKAANGTTTNGIIHEPPGAPLRAGVKAKGTTAVKAGKVGRVAG